MFSDHFGSIGRRAQVQRRPIPCHLLDEVKAKFHAVWKNV
jgi:hypothetical protein